MAAQDHLYLVFYKGVDCPPRFGHGNVDNGDIWLGAIHESDCFFTVGSLAIKNIRQALADDPRNVGKTDKHQLALSGMKPRMHQQVAEHGTFEVHDPGSGKKFTLYEFEISIARMLNGRRKASTSSRLSCLRPMRTIRDWFCRGPCACSVRTGQAGGTEYRAIVT